MANKKPKNQKPTKSSESQSKRRIKTMQIIIVIFSILLVLSMVLSLTR